MLSGLRLRVAVATVAFFIAVPNVFAEGPGVAEQAGLSTAGLARIDAYIKNESDQNKIPCAVMLIERHGKTAYFNSLGARDHGTKRPGTPDTIRRISVVSEPI